MEFSRAATRMWAQAGPLVLGLTLACSTAPTLATGGNGDIPQDPGGAPPAAAPTIGSYVPSSLSLAPAAPTNPGRVRLTVGGNVAGESYTPTNVVVVEDGVVKGIRVETGAGARLKADIAFLIDNTSSMQPGIASVRASVIAFINALRASGQDIQAGVVAFNDNFANEGSSVFVVPAADSASRAAVYGFRPLSSDLTSTGAVYTFVNTLPAVGGGDGPELALSGIDFARRTFAWRPGAQRIYIVISDITTWGRLAPGGSSKGIGAAYPWTDITLGDQLRSEGSVVHCVTPDERGVGLGEYNIRPLCTATGGTWTRYVSTGFDLTTLPIVGVTTASALVEFVKNGPAAATKARTLRVIFDGGPGRRGERALQATF